MTRKYCRAYVPAIVLLFTAITPLLCAKKPASQPTMAPGTQINVRMKDKLSSNGARAGDPFRGRLEAPITLGDNVLYPKGTEVAGYIVSSHPSGRKNDPGILELDLIAIGEGTKMASVSATTLVLKGEVHKKSKGLTMGGAVVVPDSKGKVETVVESDALLTWVVASPRSPQDWSKKPGKVYQGSNGAFRVIGHDQPEEVKTAANPAYGFNDRDRRALRKCIAARPSAAGLAAKNQLPPGSVKQLKKDTTLPAGLQKRVQPLPSSCTQQLSPVPRKWTRGLVSDRVVLLDPGSRIVDVFAL